MAQPRVIGILAEDAGAWWPELGGWIAAAVDRDGMMGLDDVKSAVANREMQLWAVLDDARPVGACVTEISAFPKARVLSAVAVGGRGAARWIAALDAALSRYGDAHDCTKFNAPVARRGWRPLARALGWRETAAYWKDLG